MHIKNGNWLQLLSIGLLLMSSSAFAVDYFWDANGSAVCTATGDQKSQVAIPDGFGGVFVAWLDFRSTTNEYGHLYVQKLNSNGDAVWTTDGIAVSTTDSICNGRSVDTAPADDSGIIVVWCDDRNGTGSKVYAQSIDKDGDLCWTTGGVDIWSSDPGGLFEPKAVPDSCGGVLVFAHTGDYYLRVGKIDADGTVVRNSTKIYNNTENIIGFFDVVPDGFWGAYAAWEDNEHDIYVQKIDVDGTAAWSQPSDACVRSDICQRRPSLITNYFGDSEPSDDVIVTWYEMASEFDSTMWIYAQKVDSSGAAIWGEPRSALSDTFVQKIGSDYFLFPIRLAPDCSWNGGAFVAWHEHNGTDYDIYIQHLVHNGWANQSWSQSGTRITNATGNQGFPSMIRNDDKGALVVWEDERNGNSDIYMQHVSKTGDIGLAGDEIVCGLDSSQTDPIIVDRKVVVWQDKRNSAANSLDLYAQKYEHCDTYFDAEDADTVILNNNICISGPFMYLIDHGDTMECVGEADDCSTLHKPRLVTDDARLGDYSLVVGIDADSATYTEGDLRKQRVYITFDENRPFFQEMYTGLSIKISADSDNPEEGSWNHIVSWRQATLDISGLLGIDLMTENDSLKLCVKGINRNHYFNPYEWENHGGGPFEISKEYLPKDEWVDIVLGYRFNPYDCGEQGWVKVWMNGEEVGLHDGIIGLPTELPGYPHNNQFVYLQRFGLYRSVQNTNMEIFFDNIRNGESYYEVALTARPIEWKAFDPDSLKVTNDSTTAYTCPAGDWNALQIGLQLDSLLTGGANVLKEDICIEPNNDSSSVLFCDDIICADSNATAANGYKTTITYEFIGGCSACSSCLDLNVPVFLDGDEIGKARHVTIKSPDRNGDGKVNLSDFGYLGDTNGKQKGDPGYDCCFDFNGDDWVNLSDLGYFGDHYSSLCTCPSFSSTLAALPLSENDIRFICSDYQKTGRTHVISIPIRLDVRFEIECAAFGVEIVQPGVRFKDWIPADETEGKIVGVPIDKDGSEIVFIGLFDVRPIDNCVRLGTIELELTDEMIPAASGDLLRLAFGDVMDSEGAVRTVGAIEIEPEVPGYCNRLYNNHPNPFNPTTTIEFSIARDTHVDLRIYNVNGQLIKTLLDEHREKNHYAIEWDGKNNNGKSVACGVYLYRIETKDFTDSKKMILLR